MEVRLMTDYGRIEQIYTDHMEKDFPANELKPLIAIRKALEEGIYECYGLFSSRTLLAYAFFVKSGRHYLLDYFAVTQVYRNKGYGSVFLNRLAGYMTDAECVICEVEDPEKAERPEEKELCERRKDFYLRNGFRMTPVRSVVFGAEFQLLTATKSRRYNAEEIMDIYAALYRSVLPQYFFETCFSVSMLPA